MKIRIVNDLHLEISPDFRLPIVADEANTVLVLAGDICRIDKLASYTEFFADVCSRFYYVLYVFGNHEFYRNKMGEAEITFKKVVADHYYNILFCSDGATIEIDDITFVMATLWTAWNHPQNLVGVSNEFSMQHCRRSMGDFFIIKDENDRTLTPQKTKLIHDIHLDYIVNAIERRRTDKVVVITHHAPSVRSIHGRFWKDDLNPAFTSHLSPLLAKLKPDVWIHGHTHDNFDYMDNEKTRIICNPRGYPGENEWFDPLFTIEL